MDEQKNEGALVALKRAAGAIERIPAAIREKVKSVSLTVRTEDGQQLEVPLGEIDATGPAAEPAAAYLTHQLQQIGFMKCGNCLDRLPRFNDPEANHHQAQAHKLVCTRRQAAADQHAQLVSEFQQQQEQLSPETKALLRQMGGVPQLPAATDSSPIAQRPRWWQRKFWPWNRWR